MTVQIEGKLNKPGGLRTPRALRPIGRALTRMSAFGAKRLDGTWPEADGQRKAR